ncbi:hypothetical protein NUW54_g2032 [Trametes sanguinea]|uniref:Uncharacterized protein n=1 Tax=Trametes sanguinea TaxID=158606 RepID=A0ACC1Q4Z3_9APHY|nr:hypothetical protein NUW54_g2032 [Trametes sanguinea]
MRKMLPPLMRRPASYVPGDGEVSVEARGIGHFRAPCTKLRSPDVIKETIAPLETTLASATLVNNTVDDQRRDSSRGLTLTYSSDISWNLGKTCEDCTPISTFIDVSQVYDGTWHDATVPPAFQSPVLTATFAGVAVYVYNVVANAIPAITTITSLTFRVDGQAAGAYSHSPDMSSSAVDYDVLVFSTSGLSNTVHTLEVGADNAFNSLVLFDRIVYTAEELDDPGPAAPVVTPGHPGRAVTTPKSSTSIVSAAASFTPIPSPSISSGSPSPLPSAISGSVLSPLPSERSSDTGHGDTTASNTLSAATPVPTVPALPSQSKDPHRTPSHQPSQSTVIGVIAGCTVATLVGTALVFYCRRRRHRRRNPRRMPSGVAASMPSMSTLDFHPLRLSDAVSMPSRASGEYEFPDVCDQRADLRVSIPHIRVRADLASVYYLLQTFVQQNSIPGTSYKLSVNLSDAVRETYTPPPPYSLVRPRAALAEGDHDTRNPTRSMDSQQSWRVPDDDPFRTPPLSRTNSSRYSGSLPPSYHSELGPPSYVSASSPV